MTISKIRQSQWLAAAAMMAASLGRASAQNPAPPAATPPAPTPPAATPASPPATATQAAPAPAPAAPPPGLWIDGIHLSAQVDAGFNVNPMRPSTGLNFGQLFSENADTVLLNQLLLTATKPLDPKNSDFQWGFKLQGMYGSDARFVQFLGELNEVDPFNRNQLAVVEADLQFHLPILTSGGVDLKVGQYPTPLGFETTDPSNNPFYSHSYIFQFGLPFGHTGFLTTTHVNEMLDIYAGLDTGTNTTFGPLGDNNGAIGGIGGVNLTLMGGKLTVLALTHMGPEQPTRVLSPEGFNANGQWRFYNDVVVTYKASDALTLNSELNWVRDDFGVANKPVNAFGATQYASYTLTDTLTLNGRIEYFRDDNNFFVAAYSGNGDYVRVEQGLAPVSPVYFAPGGSTTYGELTLGVTYKPTLPPPVTGLLIRPEVRWDHAFTDNNPFNQNPPSDTKGTPNNFTFAADAVITF
jgi:Putative beta-barrel porin-2, OmpL-like. bbp2